MRITARINSESASAVVLPVCPDVIYPSAASPAVWFMAAFVFGLIGPAAQYSLAFQRRAEDVDQK